MAVCHWQDYLFGTTKSPQESLDKAIGFAQRAVAQDNGLHEAHRTLGVLYIYNREYEKGLAEGERAMDLCPNGAETLQVYAYILLLIGRTNEAISVFEKAIRLNPKGPFFFFHNYAHALRFSGRLADSILAYKKALLLFPNHIHAHLGLAATYSLMGQEKEAQAQAKEVLKINPKFSLDYLMRTLPYKDQSLVEEYYYNPLRKAGLK
jgi:adenylate cyclase